MLSVAILSSVLSAVLAYSKCDPADVKVPITIPITKVLVTSPINVAGNIVIVDGCNFRVTGFTFSGAGPSKWYGGNGTNPEAVTLSDTAVNLAATASEQTFPFRNVVGAEVSFRDFTEFRLFEDSTRTLIATAQVPASVKANLGGSTGSVTNGTQPSATGTVGSTGATGTARTTKVSTTTEASSSNGFSSNPLDFVGLFIMALAI